MARGSDPGIDHDRNLGLLDNDRDLSPRLQPPVTADGRSEGHHGGDPDALQTLGQNGVRVDVGKDGESLRDKDLRGLESFDGIRKKMTGVWMDLELDPLGKAGGGGQTGESHGLLRGVGPAGVGQKKPLLAPEMLQNIGKRIGIPGSGPEVGPSEGDGDKLGPRGLEGTGHHFSRGELSRSHEEPGGKRSSRDDQG